MSKITEKQRRTFFMLCKKIGKDNVYNVMSNTVGIESLRDPDLTFDRMRLVLSEVLKLSKITIKRKPTPKKFRKPLASGKDNKIIKMITPSQKGLIKRFIVQVDFDRNSYAAYCKRILKKSEPESVKEAQAVIAGLKSMAYQKWKAKAKSQ